MLVTIETIAKATYSTLVTDLQKTFCAPDYFPLFQTFSPYRPLKLLEHERIENYTFGGGILPSRPIRGTGYEVHVQRTLPGVLRAL